MQLTPEQVVVLLAGLNKDRVRTKKIPGQPESSYLPTFDIRATLNRVFGFTNWSLEESADVIRTDADVPKKDGKETTNWRVLAIGRAVLTLHDPEGKHDTVYTATVSASQSGADIGEVTDFAVKTAQSDAVKRCAVNLGTQFGLSLYDNGSINDVVKRVMAPGQTEDIRQQGRDLLGMKPLPGTPEDQPEQAAAAQAMIAHALPGARGDDLPASAVDTAGADVPSNGDRTPAPGSVEAAAAAPARGRRRPPVDGALAAAAADVRVTHEQIQDGAR